MFSQARLGKRDLPELRFGDPVRIQERQLAEAIYAPGGIGDHGE
jgi:hypothetical protein